MICQQESGAKKSARIDIIIEKRSEKTNQNPAGDWEKSFSESQDILEIMAEKAFAEIREGKAEKIGWDEIGLAIA